MRTAPLKEEHPLCTLSAAVTCPQEVLMVGLLMAGLCLFKKAESKATNKLCRIGIADSDEHADALCDRQNRAGEGLRMEASSNMKSSFGRPILRRRFSFGRPSWSASESEANRKKGFWERHHPWE
ncbi:hypothetical protein B296_00002400 [Ensete ventricosum]|uniref:Uncharacterized protein n=1 Tax=Ensete ventricosum TaxID=4639 RepID=A0A427ACE8_ENSVE|nr:hypothetical protein B296_00002400 [Ensete ventricosum]